MSAGWLLGKRVADPGHWHVSVRLVPGPKRDLEPQKVHEFNPPTPTVQTKTHSLERWGDLSLPVSTENAPLLLLQKIISLTQLCFKIYPTLIMGKFLKLK